MRLTWSAVTAPLGRAYTLPGKSWRRDLVRVGLWAALAVALWTVPNWVSRPNLHFVILAMIYVLIAASLNLLTGVAGQFSLGQAMFVAIGAYSATILTSKGLAFTLPGLGWAVSVPKLSPLAALVLAGLLATLVGVVIGIPSLRISGFYLALATWALAVVGTEIITQWKDVTGGFQGLSVPRPPLVLDLSWLGLGMPSYAIRRDQDFYYGALVVVVGCLLLLRNLLRGHLGRAFQALRDNEIAAEAMGINLARTKTLAFAVSAFYAGIAGSLFAHFTQFISTRDFTVDVAIAWLVMIVVGGLGSIGGAILGGMFITFLPELVKLANEVLLIPIAKEAIKPAVEPVLYGLILILLLRFEPLGLWGRWQRIRRYWARFPL